MIKEYDECCSKTNASVYKKMICNKEAAQINGKSYS
jgi:hypothetical protein